MFVLDTCILETLRRSSTDKMRKAVVRWMGTVDEDKLYLGVGTVFEQQWNVSDMRATAAKLTKAKDETKRTKQEADARQAERQLEEMIGRFGSRIVSIDTPAARDWANMVPNKNNLKTLIDASLAAVARAKGFAVVTFDAKDFKDKNVRVINPNKLS